MTLLIHVNSMTAFNASHYLNSETWHIISIIGHQRRLEELDPDRNYFNQFTHQLNKISNYYIEDSFNKYIKRNSYEREKIYFVHSNIWSIEANLTAFMTHMSNVNCEFSIIGFSET